MRTACCAVTPSAATRRETRVLASRRRPLRHDCANASPRARHILLRTPRAAACAAAANIAWRENLRTSSRGARAALSSHEGGAAGDAHSAECHRALRCAPVRAAARANTHQRTRRSARTLTRYRGAPVAPSLIAHALAHRASSLPPVPRCFSLTRSRHQRGSFLLLGGGTSR